MPFLDPEIAALRQQVNTLRGALNWALGCGDDFPSRPDGAGPYYWRKELAQRAGLTYNAETSQYEAAREALEVKP